MLNTSADRLAARDMCNCPIQWSHLCSAMVFSFARRAVGILGILHQPRTQNESKTYPYFRGVVGIGSESRDQDPETGR